MLVALIVHPFMVWSYITVYVDGARYSYNGYNYGYPYLVKQYTFFLYNGEFIYVIATFLAGYCGFCIINGMRMIKNEQKDRKPFMFDVEKLLNFETFLGFLPLETGAIVIATTSVILGVIFTFSLRFMNYYYPYGVFVTR
jgi:hypothetical protein